MSGIDLIAQKSVMSNKSLFYRAIMSLFISMSVELILGDSVCGIRTG